MLAGHIDEIGVMVSHIDDDGFLSFDTIGGWDPQVFVGQRVQLLGRDGPVVGVVGKKAIHLMDKDDRERVSKIEDLWIDIGAANRAEASSGSASAIPASWPQGCWSSPTAASSVEASTIESARSWCWRRSACWRARRRQPPRSRRSRRPARRSRPPAVARAARRWRWSRTWPSWWTSPTPPTIPGVDKRRHGDYRLGGGPVLSRGASVSEVVFELLAAAAEAEQIPYTIEAASRDTHTDAEAIFNAHRGVATALVSVPNRYMHSPNEMVALEDLDRTARLLAAFARRLTPDTDFVPR